MPLSRPEPTVPLTNPGLENARLRSDILEAIARVIDRGNYILGTQVETFEAVFANSIGAVGAVGVASGTDALVLAMLGLRIGPGDEVIAPSHTAGPVVAAIHMIGATPVLVEIDPTTFCIDYRAVATAISPRTKAVIAVHLYGHPADMVAINRLAKQARISVVEDCAQAQGARIGSEPVGAIGDIGCFSFYPTKNLAALGDGGAVVARQQALIERLRVLRTYGWTSPQYAEIQHGRCTRLDELQAAVLSVKLANLEQNNKLRRRIAQQYAAGLADLPLVLPEEREGYRHAYHLYVVRSSERDALANRLKSRGIMTGRHYPYPVHTQPGLAAGARIPRPLALTEQLASEILSLPIFPDMTDQQIDRVIEAVREAC
jgi:dTDP-4-amino-4,6-dideoxygalactose transaminase